MRAGLPPSADVHEYLQSAKYFMQLLARCRFT